LAPRFRRRWSLRPCRRHGVQSCGRTNTSMVATEFIWWSPEAVGSLTSSHLARSPTGCQAASDAEIMAPRSPGLPLKFRDTNSPTRCEWVGLAVVVKPGLVLAQAATRTRPASEQFQSHHLHRAPAGTRVPIPDLFANSKIDEATRCAG
jgi:hypothetical protein